MASGNFNGLCVLTLESRRAQDIAKLITTWGGKPLVAPSVKEVPLESNQEAVDFVRMLREGQIEMVIFMTGGGVRSLALAVHSICPPEQLASLLNKTTIIARGPKPIAALREIEVQVTLSVPEPNTWRELLSMLDHKKDEFPLQGCRVALQEYGERNPEITSGLLKRGAIVTPVCVYEWALPDDTGPLKEAVAAIVRGEVQVLLVASSIQIRHLFQVAESQGAQNELRQALGQVVIVSVGPLTSEEIHRRGLQVDWECTHPKMGFLVREAAENSEQLLRQRRTAAAK